MRNPPEDHYLAVWIWPRALPLGQIFGAEWDDAEIRARFLTLAGQWHTRHPAPSSGEGRVDGPVPGQCRIGASLAVACRCEGGHGHHTIVETLWRSGGPAAALDALTTVLRSTDQWLAGSRHPAWWRQTAGLA